MQLCKKLVEDTLFKFLDLKNNTFKDERENNVRLRGEGGITRKKLQGVMKETEDYKNNIAKMTTEKQRLHAAVKNMEKDINDLKSEISTRYY